MLGWFQTGDMHPFFAHEIRTRFEDYEAPIIEEAEPSDLLNEEEMTEIEAYFLASK
jgi:hypothetical protein